jgi:hypothetical protein
MVKSLLTQQAMAKVGASNLYQQVFDFLWVLLYIIVSLSFSFSAIHYLSRHFVPVTIDTQST